MVTATFATDVEVTDGPPQIDGLGDALEAAVQEVVDATLLWPALTLSDAVEHRRARPLRWPADPTLACPRCGDRAFISADRRIVHCPFTCHTAFPGPGSALLIEQLQARRRR